MPRTLDRVGGTRRPARPGRSGRHAPPAAVPVVALLAAALPGALRAQQGSPPALRVEGARGVAEASVCRVMGGLTRAAGTSEGYAVARLQWERGAAAASPRGGATLVPGETPAGWMGIGLSGVVLRTLTPEGEVRHHCDYPVIETVDAGSPAARAGLMTGDTVLAYDGRDVAASPVHYGQLLQPDRVVRVRVRRGGRTLEVPVTVVARRDDSAAPVTPVAPRALVGSTIRMVPMGDLPRPVASRPDAGRLDWGPGELSRREAPRALVITSAAGDRVFLAGAELTGIDDAFATSMDLPTGLLVLRAPPMSPAAEAGLRPGDVVVAINGTRIRDPWQAGLALGTGGELQLTVSGRGGASRTVRLPR